MGDLESGDESIGAATAGLNEPLECRKIGWLDISLTPDALIELPASERTLRRSLRLLLCRMNAEPLLVVILRAMQAYRLEAILVGNAAAALHGAPVTTVDFDFKFRDTPTNLKKLKGVARELGGIILRPYYPLSKLYRLVDDDSGLQVDFMPVLDGMRSFVGLRSRVTGPQATGQWGPEMQGTLEAGYGNEF